VKTSRNSREKIKIS